LNGSSVEEIKLEIASDEESHKQKKTELADRLIAEKLKHEIQECHYEYQKLLSEKDRELQYLRGKLSGLEQETSHDFKQEEQEATFSEDTESSKGHFHQARGEFESETANNTRSIKHLGLDKKSHLISTKDPKLRSEVMYKPAFYKNHPHSVYHAGCTNVSKHSTEYYKKAAIKNKER